MCAALTMAGNISVYLCALLCVLFTSSIFVSEVNARRPSSHRPQSHHSSTQSRRGSPSHAYSSNSGRASSSSARNYPSAVHSLSGNSYGSSYGHSYPPSRLSGSGSSSGSASYPSNRFGSISGSASHGYPNSRPNSLSGGASGSSVQGYPSFNIQSSFGNQLGSAQYNKQINSVNSGSGVHTYPNSRPNSLSGGGSGSSVHTYPQTNTLSGSGSRPGSSYPQNTHYTNTYHSTSRGSNTQVHTGGRRVVYHHHYVYKPPTVIHYGYGAHFYSYPVYRGVPPPYVYEYRSSGSKYSHLLAGLALYNLGRMSATSSSHNYHIRYIPAPDEYCKFGVQYRSGNFEEMAIDCRAITYFIYEEQPQVQSPITTNIVNQTTVTTQLMYSNGSIVGPANVQNQNFGPFVPNTQTQVISANGVSQQILNSNGEVVPNTQQINSVTTTTTQVMSVTDPRFIGRPVEVKPNMECYVTRNTRYTNMKKPVPCELLQKYSASSLYNSGAMIKSSLTVILVAFAFALY